MQIRELCILFKLRIISHTVPVKILVNIDIDSTTLLYVHFNTQFKRKLGILNSHFIQVSNITYISVLLNDI